jgi:hypothetical protein
MSAFLFGLHVQVCFVVPLDRVIGRCSSVSPFSDFHLGLSILNILARTIPATAKGASLALFWLHLPLLAAFG